MYPYSVRNKLVKKASSAVRLGVRERQSGGSGGEVDEGQDQSHPGSPLSPSLRRAVADSQLV